MITSRNTSINVKKVPAIFHHLNMDKLRQDNRDLLLDWGCGKYDTAKDYTMKHGINWIGYDPYNRTEAENDRAMILYQFMSSGVANGFIVCSNVLNVLSDSDAIRWVANMLQCAVSPFFVSVYEGDKSEVGRVTKEDCYQRNEPLKAYLQYFPGAVIKHGVITNHPEYIK